MGEQVRAQYEGSPSRGKSTPKLGAAKALNLSLGRPVWDEADVLRRSNWVKDVGPCCSQPPLGPAMELAKHLKKMLSPNLIAGAGDTNTVTLVWAISLLLNNRDVLKKAQDELDIQVGKERVVEDSDINKLVYLQAIVKETLRLYPAAPLGAPREFSEDCIIGGYHVPKGTRLITNIWKIQTDSQIWSDPLEFKLERFLSTHKDFDVRGTNFELIPFGSGRRVCPGTTFALQVVHLTLARLFQMFEISTPLNAPVDMTGSFGLTNMKATPLEVLIKPRLPSKLYALKTIK